MNKLEHAARQALDALDWLYKNPSNPPAYILPNARNALREALEQPVSQEPVAWNDLDDDELAHKLGWRIGDPLYMTIVGIGQEAIHHFKAQNTAPVRTKDLTDDVCDEIIKMAEKECGVSTNGWDCLDPRFIVRAVIAADRKLNGVEK